MQKSDEEIKNTYMENLSGQQWYILPPNGKAYPKILLNVADEKQREELIAKTFLKFYEHKYKTRLPNTIAQRDSPHDFTFSDSKSSFKIEIVGIEDSEESIKQQRQQKDIENKISDLAESFLIFLPKNTSNKDIQNISEQAHDAPLGNIEDGKYPHLPKNPCKSRMSQVASFKYFWNQCSGSFHFKERMTEARIDVVSAPRCVFEPKDVRLLMTKCLKALSALLLSMGIPGCLRKVKYFSLFFRRAALILERGVGSRA